MVKSLPAMQDTQTRCLSGEDPLEKGMTTHSSILACRTPWTEEPCGLQSMGSQRVRHDWMTNALPTVIILAYWDVKHEWLLSWLFLCTEDTSVVPEGHQIREKVTKTDWTEWGVDSLFWTCSHCCATPYLRKRCEFSVFIKSSVWNYIYCTTFNI